MAGKSVVEFIEEWQSGFFIVLGTALVAVVSGVLVRSLVGAPGFLLGMAGGAAVAFLAFSYLLYGRG